MNVFSMKNLIRSRGTFNDMDNSKELTHISLCTGYGGIDLGLKRVIGNLRTIVYSEIEAYAVANLVAKIEAGLLDAAPIWSDLKTFPWRRFRGRVDILSGGFPCQPFSAAGRRRGDEDPRHLFPYIKRGIALLRPSIIFLENVEGIISSKLGKGWSDREGTSVLLHVLRELERLGYEATSGIFSASEIGAPHQRKRVFIMAYSDQGRSSKERMDVSSTGSSKYSSQGGGMWPARRGEEQFGWEPSRIISNSNCERTQISTQRIESSKQQLKRNLSRKTESAMGRDVNGDPDWMDYVQLCESVCNRTDELRLLGNGVVPSTAERAFRILWRELSGHKKTPRIP